MNVEATGTALSQDRIVEIAYTRIMPNGRAISESLILNPGMEIAPEASAIHGITDEEVKGKPTFKEKSQKLWDIFNNCYYGGFNIVNFDLPILKREFLRVGMDLDYRPDQVIDAKVIFNYMEPRTLSFAYKYYCDKEHTGKINSQREVEIIMEVLEAQFNKYEETRSLDFIKKIHKFKSDRFVDSTVRFYWQNGEAYFAFSKYKGKSLNEVVKSDPEFLEWMLESDFSEEAKSIVIEALKNLKERDGRKYLIGEEKIHN